MKKRIQTSIFAVLAAGLVLCVLLTALIVDRKLTKQTEIGLVNLATALSRSYDANGDADAQAKMFAADGENLRVTVIAADGTVRGDSQADYRTMENHADRAEVKEAKGGRAGVAVRTSYTLRHQQMYAAVRMQNGETLRLATQYAGVVADVFSLLPALGLAGLVALMMAMAVSGRFSASITAPIAALSAGIKRVQEGGAPLIPETYCYEELQGMAGDINRMSDEIHKNMSRLAREKAKIDSILNNMNEGFVLLDENQTVLLMNEAACAAFCCERARAVGKNLVHTTRNVALLQAVSAVLDAQNEQPHTTLTLPLASGAVDEVTVSAVRADDPLTKQGGVILLLSDVTERQNAVQMRQQFFESASHELKTPITSVKGFAELLCSDVPLSTTQQSDIAARILKETTRMNSLIGDIIMISRLESGDICFEREVLDVARVVTEVCSEAMPLAAQNDIIISCETQPCVRSASAREMSELVGNLVSNAVRYNKKGGRVEVKLQTESGVPILTVFNTGEPIPPAYQARIFERFYRMDKGRSKASGGTGLGLAIVKHIAGVYGAAVSVSATA
ncbi:MAG: histidine kinase dimerization/phospho-acceptor domain-containing protein, partial [Ruthenibacterium sp.]